MQFTYGWIGRAGIGLLMVAMLAACGDESSSNNGANNGANNGSNNGTADAGNNGGADMDLVVDNSDKTYESSYQVRFERLHFDETSPAGGLNDILAQNFDQSLEHPIIVLLDIQNIDTDAGTVEVRGGAGLKGETDGEYEWHPEADDTLFSGTLQPDDGTVHIEDDLFEFIATIPTESDPIEVTLPIHNLVLDGSLRLLDGGATADIPDGDLTGYITKEEADNIEVSLGPDGPTTILSVLLKPTKVNYDTSTMMKVEEGEGDAWYLEADFNAVPTTINDGN